MYEAMNSMTPAELNALRASADCIVRPEEMDAVYARMAHEITRELSSALPLVLCVMNGGLIPAGKLLARMSFPLEIDYIHASRYAGATTGGVLQWKRHPETLLAGRQVLVIDDILDEGHTLVAIRNWCLAGGAERVWLAAPVEKEHDRKAPDIRCDYVGLSVPDRYIFGEGMDYKGYFRNLPGIHALPETL
jgi:hypoxanthine phosphoribosyltransferase